MNRHPIRSQYSPCSRAFCPPGLSRAPQLEHLCILLTQRQVIHPAISDVEAAAEWFVAFLVAEANTTFDHFEIYCGSVRFRTARYGGG
jgi:hypothetical protein